MTLREAHAALRRLLPKSVNITVQLSSHDYTHNPGPYVAWQVWDGENWHKGGTLEAAVRLCIDRHLFAQPDTNAEAEAVVAGLLTGAAYDDAVVPVGETGGVSTLGEPATAVLG